jgi:hypothetical protein
MNKTERNRNEKLLENIKKQNQQLAIRAFNESIGNLRQERYFEKKTSRQGQESFGTG